MKLVRLIAVGLLFAMISSSPASALFGSECRKPKSSFNEQFALSKKLNKAAYDFTAREKAAFYLEQRKKKETSFNNCLAEKLFSRSSCEALTNLPPESGLVRSDILLKSERALNTAYRIVLNNQKCFDPIIVVDAQRFFGK
jgi:hypothetical protein